MGRGPSERGPLGQDPFIRRAWLEPCPPFINWNPGLLNEHCHILKTEKHSYRYLKDRVKKTTTYFLIDLLISHAEQRELQNQN